MKKYKILDHPADLKIKAFGRSLPEVFANAGLAIADQQLSGRAQSSGSVEKITLESDALDSLLVDWLNEILYQGDINKKVYTDFKIEKFSEAPFKIQAEMRGVLAGQKELEIKAVTYHDLKIEKTADGWEATVVFDI